MHPDSIDMAMASPTITDPHQAFDAVVWDYDGTLVASRNADEHAVEELLRMDPRAAAGVALFWQTEGCPIEDRVERAWPGRSAELLPLFEVRIAPIVFPGIRATLRGLEKRGYRMGVVSSRRRDALLWGLQATGLIRHFTIVLGLDDVARPKPAPEGLLSALRHLGVLPSRAVYVGDSEVDVLAARAGGVTVWRAGWCATPPCDEAAAHLITRPAEVLALIAPFEATGY